MWFGADPQPACYNLPINVNPKYLVLLTPSGAWYPNGILGPAAGPLPAAASACVGFTVPRAVGPGQYTLAVLDQGSGNYLAGVSFAADVLTVSFVGLAIGPGAGQLQLTVQWSIPAGRASPSDTVKLVDRAGRAVLSFRPSQVVAGARGRAVPSGTHSVTLRRPSPPPPPGGLAAKFYPSDGAVAAGTALDWIPWRLLGW